jgi:hypothetical protein
MEAAGSSGTLAQAAECDVFKSVIQIQVQREALKMLTIKYTVYSTSYKTTMKILANNKLKE